MDLMAVVISDVLEELESAIKKFPTWPNDPLHALAVLSEEYGELSKGMLQVVYEPGKTTLNEVRQEAIQVAAMTMRLIKSLDVYSYKKCSQHTQG